MTTSIYKRIEPLDRGLEAIDNISNHFTSVYDYWSFILFAKIISELRTLFKHSKDLLLAQRFQIEELGILEGFLDLVQESSSDIKLLEEVSVTIKAQTVAPDMPEIESILKIDFDNIAVPPEARDLFEIMTDIHKGIVSKLHRANERLEELSDFGPVEGDPLDEYPLQLMILEAQSIWRRRKAILEWEGPVGLPARQEAVRTSTQESTRRRKRQKTSS